MQRAKPFASGKPPNPPKSVIVNCYPLLSLRSRGELTHKPPTAVSLAMLKGHWWVAHCMASHSGWLSGTTALPERGRERLANIHPRATKKSLLNIAKETAHPSVGRSLSAGHHRLILPLCRLRLNAPPQDRLHRSNVTMLARAIAQYTAP